MPHSSIEIEDAIPQADIRHLILSMPRRIWQVIGLLTRGEVFKVDFGVKITPRFEDLHNDFIMC